jgi:hypothetical protein
LNNIIKSRTKAWYGDEEVVYKFPSNWELEVFSPETQPELNETQIQQMIMNSIGCEPLTQLLKPGMKICIISDDISRPTRTDLIIPILFKVLKSIGILLKDIFIVIASGAHSPMNDKEKLLKFGSNVARSVKLIDHNYRKDLVHLGRTSLGTPVYVNRYVAESDFVIGVGGIYPQNDAGFGGGAKIILGVSGNETIKYFHFMRSKAGRGGSIENQFRKDLLEAAQLSGLNFIINNLLSKDRKIIDIFAGDVQEAFLAGVNKAKKIYSAPNPKKFSFDLVVADTYPFDTTLILSRKGWWPIHYCDEESHRLIISAIPSGVGQHALFPFSTRSQYLINRICQLRTFTAKEIVQIILGNLKSTIRKTNDKTSFQHPVTLVHSLNKNLVLPNSKIHFTNSFRNYINRIQQIAGNQSLRVCFYQASSLTFQK